MKMAMNRREMISGNRLVKLWDRQVMAWHHGQAHWRPAVGTASRGFKHDEALLHFAQRLDHAFYCFVGKAPHRRDKE